MATPEKVEDANKFHDLEFDKPDSVLKIASPGLRLVGERKLLLDHHLCDKVLGYKEIKGERPLRPHHVDTLINAMLRGTFHYEWVRLIACEQLEEGQTYRMNGQHTSLARLQLPKAFKSGAVSIMTYEAKNYDAMRELYSSIDRGAPRTRGNVVNSYLYGAEGYEDLPGKVLRLLAEGLSFWLWENTNERIKHDADETVYLMNHDHKNLVQLLASYCMEQPRLLSCKWMIRASVVAAMYETFHRVTTDSKVFWDTIKTGLNVTSASDPRIKLKNALQEYKVLSKSTGGTARNKSADQETLYRWSINAFNRWRRGESMQAVCSTKERQRAK